MKKLVEVGKMRRFAIGGLLALAFFLIAVGAQASTVDFNATHNLTLSVYPTLSYVSGSGMIYSGMTGEDDSDSNQNVRSSKTVSGSGTTTTTANGTLKTYLKTGNTTTSATGYSAATISHTFQGLGPDPADGGYIGQHNYNDYQGTTYYQKWYMQFTVPTTSNYAISLSDVYNLSFSLNQGTGSLNPFTQLSRSSIIYLNIDNGTLGSTNHDTIYDVATGNGTSYIDSISTNLSGPANVEFANWYAVAGRTLTISAWVVDRYDGTTAQTSPVPAPPTLILLGSGLVGLLALGRRRKANKA